MTWKYKRYPFNLETLDFFYNKYFLIFLCVGSSDDVVLLSKEEIVDGGKPNTDDNEDKHPENKQKEEKG